MNEPHHLAPASDALPSAPVEHVVTTAADGTAAHVVTAETPVDSDTPTAEAIPAADPIS